MEIRKRRNETEKEKERTDQNYELQSGINGVSF